MAFAFDTLVQARRLREAGFDEKQAEALTAVLRDAIRPFDTSELATEADLADLATKGEFATLKADLAAHAVATKAEFAALKADLAAHAVTTKAEFAALRSDLVAKIAETRADLLQWIIGLIAGAVVLNAFVVVGSIFGLLKLLGH